MVAELEPNTCGEAHALHQCLRSFELVTCELGHDQINGVLGIVELIILAPEWCITREYIETTLFAQYSSIVSQLVVHATRNDCDGANQLAWRTRDICM